MVIFHLITSLKIGGAESALVNFLRRTRKDDTHIVAYFYDGPNAKAIADLGIETYYVKGLFHRYDPIALWRLLRYIKKKQPAIMHTALPVATIVGCLFGKLLDMPVIADLHGDPADHGWVRNVLERMTVNIPVRLVAVSRSIKASFEKTLLAKCRWVVQKNVKKKLRVICNGIDAQVVRQQASQHPLTREAVGLQHNDFVIGSVGRLEAIKSYDVLIEACSYLVHNGASDERRIMLCLVGDGSNRAALERKVKQMDISDRVLFAGMRSDPYRWYRIFDCFALSSQSEGLSIALLEAMAFGLPIVSTHTSKMHDVIEDGVGGFLVAPGNAHDMAKALKRLYENPGLIIRMRQHNMALVASDFSLLRVVKVYEQLYDEVASSCSSLRKAQTGSKGASNT